MKLGMDGEVGWVDLRVTGEKHGIKYDQNTLHGILKGLIKYFLKTLNVKFRKQNV